MSVNARTTKARESTDGDLSIVPTDCCRLCTGHNNAADGRILNHNKSPSTTSSNQATDRGNKALEFLKDKRRTCVFPYLFFLLFLLDGSLLLLLSLFLPLLFSPFLPLRGTLVQVGEALHVVGRQRMQGGHGLSLPRISPLGVARGDGGRRKGPLTFGRGLVVVRKSSDQGFQAKNREENNYLRS
ncbi:hypothetical protein AVEN_217072-1 [Araneus ventricosus]|uniref:Uncharacterized protein n=1 Tax=Araneus ventricosus TaxID=182803 RepID=A0A4Y2NLZ3_ARAVE|nr:hypothetical protein AVEN_217072-1 [Araneus ventricosus]